MQKTINILLIASTSFLFTACTGSNAEMPVSDSPSFKLGEKDGCSTASGLYTKNSDAFNIDADYKNGWYYGRKNCNPSQAK